jgi:hypothetical protein
MRLLVDFPKGINCRGAGNMPVRAGLCNMPAFNNPRAGICHHAYRSAMMINSSLVIVGWERDHWKQALSGRPASAFNFEAHRAVRAQSIGSCLGVRAITLAAGARALAGQVRSGLLLYSAEV